MILDPTGSTSFSIPGENDDYYTGNTAMLIITNDSGDGINGATGTDENGYTQQVQNSSTRKGVVITADGSLYANKGFFSGTINATSGKIGGWTINSKSISATNTSDGVTTSIILSSSGKISLASNAIIEDEQGNEIYTVDSGFVLDAVAKKFKITNIDIVSGTVSNSTTLQSAVQGEDNVTIGTVASNGIRAVKKGELLDNAVGETPATTAFTVTANGKLTCTGATITGGNNGSGNLIEGINATNGTVSFSVSQKGKLTCTGADISGTMTAGSIQAGVSIETPTISSGLYLPQGTIKSTSSYTGLILNLTNSGHYGGWRDSLFTIGGNNTNPFYAFIRGAGSQSNERTNAFLGVQNQSTSYTISNSADGPTSNSNNPTENYVAYIRFDGTAYFSTLTIGNSINVGTKLTGLSNDVTTLQSLLASLTDRVEILESKV